MLGFGTDVTDARQAESALASSERQHRALLDALHDGVWQVDGNGLTTFVNPSMAEMLGYSVDEMIGRPVFAFCDEKTVEAAKRHLMNRRAGLRETYEFELRTKDGRRVHTLVAGAPQFDESGEYAGGVAGVQDITEHLRAEEEPAVLERKLLETQKLESLGVLAGGIAHDFNNILTGIIGSTSLARMDLPATSEAHEHTVQIESSARRAADLCRQMLAYAGKGRFVVQNLDLSQLVRETTQLLDLSISKRRRCGTTSRPGHRSWPSTLRRSDPTGPDEPRAERERGPRRPSRFDHACDGYPDGRPRVPADVRDRGRPRGRAVRIPGGQRQRLRDEQGDGQAELRPVLHDEVHGEGPRAERRPRHRAWPQGRHQGLQRGRSRDGVQALLPHGHGVLRIAPAGPPRGAADGRKGLEIVREKGSTLAGVLLDLTMPNMDGETAFREIRAIHPDLPIVLMSGYNEQDAVARFAGKGLAGFLQKPFTVDAMRTVLRTHLGAGR